MSSIVVDVRTGQVIAVPAADEVLPPGPDPIEEWRVTAVVSRFQARVAMLDAGILADVEASLAGAGVLAQMAWAEATEFRRNSPMIAEIAAGLGLSPEQVDDLFRAAAAVVV